MGAELALELDLPTHRALGGDEAGRPLLVVIEHARQGGTPVVHDRVPVAGQAPDADVARLGCAPALAAEVDPGEVGAVAGPVQAVEESLGVLVGESVHRDDAPDGCLLRAVHVGEAVPEVLAQVGGDAAGPVDAGAEGRPLQFDLGEHLFEVAVFEAFGGG